MLFLSIVIALFSAFSEARSPPSLQQEATLLSTLIPNNDSASAAYLNALVIKQAIDSPAIKAISIPNGTYFLQGPINHTRISHKHIEIIGDLVFTNDWKNYPHGELPGTTENQRFAYADLWRFDDCHFISITGQGSIDGQGYEWWKASLSAFLGHKKLATDNRPKLLHFYQSTNLHISSVRLLDSPMFHLNLEEVANVSVIDVSVFVHVKNQHKLHQKASSLSVFDRLIPDSLPLWPLNTDGIDPQGVNITIRNFTYRGFDDAIAVKPQNQHTKYSACSSDILIDGANISFGIGIAMGSVPSNSLHNCIDKVIVRNIAFHHPFKSIYIKSNPDVPSSTASSPINNTGLISNIIYDITNSIWWPIYIGLQQQKQPPGKNETKGFSTGCPFAYPLLKCKTNPRVTFANITLRNVDIVDSKWPWSGSIVADPSNPATGFVFENITTRRSGSGVLLPTFGGYLCGGLDGASWQSVDLSVSGSSKCSQ